MTTSPSSIMNSGTSPPMAVKESCIEFTAPHDAAVVMVAKSDGVEDAKAHLLALHVAIRSGDAELLMNRIA
jgi:hypothetical protein